MLQKRSNTARKEIETLSSHLNRLLFIPPASFAVTAVASQAHDSHCLCGASQLVACSPIPGEFGAPQPRSLASSSLGFRRRVSLNLHSSSSPTAINISWVKLASIMACFIVSLSIFGDFHIWSTRPPQTFFCPLTMVPKAAHGGE